ncbi:hypothetical protein ACP70R_004592 [Stipagrostis hirtigluma subsp. patula]
MARQPWLPSAETDSPRGRGATRACTTRAEPQPDQSGHLARPTSPSWAVKRPRTRRPRPHSGRSWAALTYGPVGLIAERALANDVVDYVRFRAVCRAWRWSTEDGPRAQGCLDRRFHPRRWIMLREPPRHGHGARRRRFLNVSTGQCIQMELPELDGRRLLGATAEGLLALLDVSTYVICLLNPLTRQLVEFPSIDPLLSEETRTAISDYGLGYALKVSGLGLADDSTFALFFCRPTMLVVAKPGDDHWTQVDIGKRWLYHSAMSFSGRFYCANLRAVMALEVPTANHQQPRLAVVAKITERGSKMMTGTVHLVESDGNLLLLHRVRPVRKSDGRQPKYKAYRVDLDTQETVPIRGLGGHTVFLGMTSALSVAPRVFPSIRVNTVYLGFDCEERIQDEKIGAYCLLNGRVECSRFSIDNGWVHPCDICDYLSWYVSGYCRDIDEI